MAAAVAGQRRAIVVAADPVAEEVVAVPARLGVDAAQIDALDFFAQKHALAAGVRWQQLEQLFAYRRGTGFKGIDPGKQAAIEVGTRRQAGKVKQGRLLPRIRKDRRLVTQINTQRLRDARQCRFAVRGAQPCIGLIRHGALGFTNEPHGALEQRPEEGRGRRRIVPASLALRLRERIDILGQRPLQLPAAVERGGQVHARGVGARLQLERAAVLDDGLGEIARFVAIATEVVARVEIFRVSVDRPAQQFAGAGKIPAAQRR